MVCKLWKGNLLLEFSEKGFYNLFPIEQCGDLTKPSIPTDKEIETIADKEVDKVGTLYFDTDKEIGYFREGVKRGYKQALKDLGHE
jgi:hypothetical protein